MLICNLLELQKECFLMLYTMFELSSSVTVEGGTVCRGNVLGGDRTDALTCSSFSIQ